MIFKIAKFISRTNVKNLIGNSRSELEYFIFDKIDIGTKNAIFDTFLGHLHMFRAKNRQKNVVVFCSILRKIAKT